MTSRCVLILKIKSTDLLRHPLTDKCWPEDGLGRDRHMQPYWDTDGCVCCVLAE
jgi:hypothetical protein